MYLWFDSIGFEVSTSLASFMCFEVKYSLWESSIRNATSDSEIINLSLYIVKS